VDAHHGTISCESAKGAGSRFTVTFQPQVRMETYEAGQPSTTGYRERGR
jgi:hypothetical protein